MNKSTLKDLNDWLSGLHNKMLSSLSAKKLLDYFYCVREEELLSIDRSGTKTKFLVASVDYKQTSCLGLFETKSYNNGERNADDALIILYYDLLYGETCLVLSLTKKQKLTNHIMVLFLQMMNWMILVINLSLLILFLSKNSFVMK